MHKMGNSASNPDHFSQQMAGVADSLQMDFQDARLISFWQRWSGLHTRFFRKLSLFDPSGSNIEQFLQAEQEKFLKKRRILISTAVQYFHSAGQTRAHEARMFYHLIANSDRVVVEELETEIARLRALHQRLRKNSKVIGAYARTAF